MENNILNTDKKYDLIYADPPWEYKTWSKKGRGRCADNHYEVLTQKQIQDLPIEKISSDNAVLFLWVTAPCLLEGIELINKWGFIYKTIGFAWVKKNKIKDSWFWGMGHYTRANIELCLIATKGKPLKRISKSIHQIVDSRIREHSRKPDEVREKIVELFGDIPRIELFARQHVGGWDCWGLETNKFNGEKSESNNCKRI